MEQGGEGTPGAKATHRQARLKRMINNNSDYQLFLRQAQQRSQAKRSGLLIAVGVAGCLSKCFPPPEGELAGRLTTCVLCLRPQLHVHG